MRTVRLQPDHEYLVMTWLGQQFHEDGITVVDQLFHGWEDRDLPLVQVSRSGGRPVNSLLDGPRIDVDCYTDAETTTKRACAELARVVEAVLPAIKGVTVTEPDGTLVPGVVTDVGIEAGPSWRPDFNPKVHHYGVVASLVVRHSKQPRR